jgi:hypothetical protein
MKTVKTDGIKAAHNADITATQGVVVIFAGNGQTLVMTPDLAEMLADNLKDFAGFARHISPLDLAPGVVPLRDPGMIQ